MELSTNNKNTLLAYITKEYKKRRNYKHNELIKKIHRLLKEDLRLATPTIFEHCNHSDFLTLAIGTTREFKVSCEGMSDSYLKCIPKGARLSIYSKSLISSLVSELDGLDGIMLDEIYICKSIISDTNHSDVMIANGLDRDFLIDSLGENSVKCKNVLFKFITGGCR